MLARTLLRLSVFAFALPVAALAREVGYVIDVQGSWVDQQHNQKVVPMYIVHEDSQIVRQGTPSTSDRIRLRFFATGEEERFDCGRPLSCNGRLNIVGRLKNVEETRAPNEARTFLSVIADLLATRPAIYSGYARLLSRATPQGMMDAVVPTSREGLNLANVFQHVGAGTFLLELCPVNADGEAICPPLPVAHPLVWKPNQSVFWPTSGITDGLYRLIVCERFSGNIVRSGDSVFVLASTVERYDVLHRRFARAADEASAWSAQDPAALPLLRVYLHYLAFQP